MWYPWDLPGETRGSVGGPGRWRVLVPWDLPRETKRESRRVGQRRRRYDDSDQGALRRFVHSVDVAAEVVDCTKDSHGRAHQWGTFIRSQAA